MTMKRHSRLSLPLAVLLTIGIASGCSNDNTPTALGLQEIPVYPGAREGESMSGSSMGGIARGGLRQYTTHDAYDEVLHYYQEALEAYQPQTLSHTSELGRQAAISVQQDGGMTSVTVQEFTAEGIVNITIMQVQN